MKGSAIAQGLKSLASALHPQLPLSPRESQRLLTALTSSFRQQLDQAHPRQAVGDENRPVTRATGNVNGSRENLHTSSAVLADRHLASVLTNPLLAKTRGTKTPGLSYESAKIDLQKDDYAKDPVSLLEEYHEKGAATIAIAALCLQSFKQSVDRLATQDRHAFLAKTAAGRRSLHWLWKSELYKTDAFVENLSLMDITAWLLIQEGYEEFLWDWVSLDHALGYQISASTGQIPVSGKPKDYKYRWKGRILRAIVGAKLELGCSGSADDALDAFNRAHELHLAATKLRNAEHWYPLVPAAICLHKFLARVPSRHTQTDPLLFDRFLTQLDRVWKGEQLKLQVARLQLAHPKQSSPLPALDVLKGLFAEVPPSDEIIYNDWVNPLSTSRAGYRYKFMLITAAQLQALARDKDAEWVLSLARRLYPRMATFIDQDVRKYRPAHTLPKRHAEERTAANPGQISLPSFT